MINLAVAGAAGRMGKTILTLASRDKAFKIVGGLEHPQSVQLGRDIGEWIGISPLGVYLESDIDKVLNRADVLIDFTHASTTKNYLQAVMRHKTAYVLGTTGLPDATVSLLYRAAKKISIVQSPNMSVGVNLLFKLAQLTSKILDENYDIEIAEIHHRMKKDAPSGTAVKLLELMCEIRGKKFSKDVIYARKGETGARVKGKLGAMALRGGDVVGDHTIYFLGDGERIELIHRASSRDAFAQGALRAAKFVARRRAGLYNMSQVLGIA